MKIAPKVRTLVPLLLTAAAACCAAACCPGGPPAPPPTTPPPTAAPTAEAPPEVVKPGPPLARREEVSETIHGTVVHDPYRWLEDGKSDETAQWLAQLNGYTRQHLDELPGRDGLTKRLTELSYIEAVSAPVRRGARFFFRRRHKDKEKSIWYWRQGRDGEPTVLLDPNTMSEDGSVSLKGVWPSYDGKWAAYKLSENNADEATMYVMDVKSRKVSDVDTIVGAKYASASWDPKGRGFYYVRLPVDPSIPTAERPGHAEAYFHRLGTKATTDKLVHEKTGDAKTFIDAELSRDGHYLFFYKHYGWAKNDVYFKDLRKHKEWQPLAVGLDAKFYVYAWKDRLYIHTNHQASRWRVMRAAPKRPQMAQWLEIVPERDQAVLRDVNVVGEHLALSYLDKASSRLEIAKLNGTPLRTVALPGIGSVRGPGGNPEDDTAYYAFSSYTTPTTIYETSIKSGASKIYFELDVPVDPKPYAIEQVWVESKDGTQVSMFIVSARGMKKDGSTPFLLTGYGGFDINQTPSFHAPRFAWLERGGGLAIPNLRGGGEYGEDWHRQGMLENKQNTFDDFIAAAEFLIAKGYTKAERLGIYGASNGGLLVGAAMVQRPELFQA
ncbi:MAG: S9 family peptidase, partial [Deltaproteobacteria bacterium]|nr:S9 family peptidase [Deltaproteobacteria bacterium]